jgi:hypothetical protein
VISAPQILQYVVNILQAADRPLVAREICIELQKRAVIIDKAELNHILWKQNDRRDLIVDQKTFKWSYSPEAAIEAQRVENRIEETRKELSKHAGLLEFWENIGFEFIGVRRKNTEKPLFFLREDGDHYVLIGPTGNLLTERSVLCSEPEPIPPNDFTEDQVKKAASEIIDTRYRNSVANAHEIIALLRDTELSAMKFISVRQSNESKIPYRSLALFLSRSLGCYHQIQS